MKKSIKILGLFLILLLGSFCWAGCGRQARTPSEEAQTVTAADGTGRQVTVPANVKRIVSNYGIAMHMVFALGAQNRLVGIDSPSRGNRFSNALKPETSTMPTVGSPREFNMEEAMALKPDGLKAGSGTSAGTEQETRGNPRSKGP